MRNENISTLKIDLLGEFCVSFDSKPMHFSTLESESTCAFLMLNRSRSFNRKRILSILFPDLPTSCAQKRLRNDIWRIKAMFEASGLDMGSYFHISNRDVGFLPAENTWIDLEEFEKVASVCTNTSHKVDNSGLIEKMDLYKGDLLEGFNQEWCVWEKERIKMLYLKSLEVLMGVFKKKEDWQRAIELGKQLVMHDPLREHVHRELMRFFYAQGDRPAAIKQYFDCRDRLAIELDVAPMQSTQDLFAAIEQETLPRVSSSGLSSEMNSFMTQIDEIGKKVNEIKLLADNIHQAHDDVSNPFKL